MRYAVLPAAVALAVSAAVPAQAAEGFMILNDEVIAEPSGCYASPLHVMSLENRTDATVEVYAEKDCQGRAIKQVSPNTVLGMDGAQSVRVP